MTQGELEKLILDVNNLNGDGELNEIEHGLLEQYYFKKHRSLSQSKRHEEKESKE